MSLNISMKSPSKKEISEILNAVSKLIEVSSNETISIDLELTFNKDKK